MAFRIGRTLPPAAAPIYLKDIVSGITGLFRGGNTITKFEEDLREYYKVKHCFAVSSGKTALTVILQSLKAMYPERDEVLIPAFTCYSVPSAIVRAGLKVRLCDLAPGTFDFDYEKLSAIISANKDRLLCVVPVHLFGIPADIERLRKLLDDNSIVIVEDAAQAMGGEHNGKKLGTFGDVGFFSLGRGKALSTVEGGGILTNRDDIARHMEKAVNAMPGYGISELAALILYAFALFVLSRPSMFWLPKALPILRLGETIYDPNFKIRMISSFQAGLARGWKRKLRQFKNTRSENMRDLLEILKKIDICPAWAGRLTLLCPIRFPLLIEDLNKRELILRMSKVLGLGIVKSYPDSIDSISELHLDSTNNRFPVAKEYAEKLVTLPVHPYVNGKDIGKITHLLSATGEI